MLFIGSGVDNGSLSFVQQGQVDWVAFGRTTWTATSEVLQRFASANVQPITFGAGIILAEQFRLAPEGQARMEEAIARVRGVQAFQDLLWLGFGYRSLVGTLASTVGGIKCITLCACLADVHSEPSAATILQELWRAYNFPEQYEPSHSQFLALVEICSGVIVKTPFTQIIDIMLGDMLWKVPHGSISEIPEASNPKDLAKALRGLFRLSRGECDSITITGGGECAFIAALAHWLFNFKIRVENEKHDLIFSNAPYGSALQVRIQYGSVKHALVEISGTTYLLGDFREAIDRIPNERDALLNVRTEWSGCLRRVFGLAAQDLLALPSYIGSYFGSLARIYAALAHGEPDVGTLSRTLFYDFPEGCHGQGFVETVLSTFPELRDVDGLRNHMELALGVSFQTAFSKVESSVHILESICQCQQCLSRKSQESSDMDYARSCYLGIIYAIRDITRTMASVVLDTEDERPLLPTIQGIKSFSRYGKSQRLLRQWVDIAQQGFAQKKTAYLGEKTDFAYFALGLGEQESEAHVNFHPMKMVSILFQGPSAATQESNAARFHDLARYQEIISPITALCYNGVCCYADVLRYPTCNPENTRLVHVLPGQIRYKDLSYQQIQDSHTDSNPAPSGPFQEIARVSPAPVQGGGTLSNVDRQSPYELQAIAFKSSIQTVLFCSYRILTPTGSLNLYPSRFMMRVLQRSGQVPCSRSSKCRKGLAMSCSIVDDGWVVDPEKTKNLTFLSNIACCLWPDRHDVEKCIVLANHPIIGISNMSTNGIFLRRDECLPCCTEALLKEGGKISTHQRAGHKLVMHIV